MTETDTHTYRHTTTAYTALSIASRGKNERTIGSGGNEYINSVLHEDIFLPCYPLRGGLDFKVELCVCNYLPS